MEIDSYSFLSYIKNSFNEVKEDIEYNSLIEKWHIYDQIIYNLDKIKEHEINYKLKLNENRNYETKQNLYKALHSNDTILDLQWDIKNKLSKFNHEKNETIYNEKLKNHDEINSMNEQYNNYLTNAFEFLKNTKLLLVTNLKPTDILSTQKLSDFLNQYIIKLKDCYKYKFNEELCFNSLQYRYFHGLNYEKNNDYKIADENAKLMVKQLIMIIYYIPKANELINDILFFDFMRNKSNEYLLKSMKNRFKYDKESYLTKLYYFTGLSWNWSGWITYLYNKVKLDLDYIDFLRKCYNVNNETFDKIDFIEYLLNNSNSNLNLLEKHND